MKVPVPGKGVLLSDALIRRIAGAPASRRVVALITLFRRALPFLSLAVFEFTDDRGRFM